MSIGAKPKFVCSKYDKLVKIDHQMDDLIALLGSVFGEQDAETLQRLADMATRVKLSTRQLYQQQGGTISSVVVVVSGTLRISLTNTEGKRFVLRALDPGQILNLVPVLDGGKAIHDACAATSTELLLLPKEAFLALLEANRALRKTVDGMIYFRVRALTEALADAMLLTLRQRCARAIIYAIDNFGILPETTTTLSANLSQTELAEMLGYSRPVVNRELMKLKREGVIDIGYQRIILTQPSRLCEIAGLKMQKELPAAPLPLNGIEDSFGK